MARRQIQPSEAEAIIALVDACEHGIAPLIEQRLVGDSAGGDDADNLSLHRPLGFSGLVPLLTYRHRFAFADQSSEVGV